MDGHAPPAVRRLRIEATGAVQGVGFRPFIHRLATAEGLGGFVQNTGAGAALEIEGTDAAIAQFLHRLDSEIKPPARIEALHSHPVLPRGEAGFAIVASVAASAESAVVLPDLATCPACRAELFDPADRRHRYPFTTCTHCGPRYSIIEAVPYDRERTTMRRFPMCPACQAEYADPMSRRFHAETNACPDCGPQLSLMDGRGGLLAERNDALLHAAQAIRDGAIVALKGLGGFQLIADARNENAVRRLRERKRRPAKPFATMVSAIGTAVALAHVTDEERRLLTSPAAPIVLVRAWPDAALAPSVAPDNPLLGVMLPYTPLHHLLMRDLNFPVVATSGNHGDEPIVIDEADALMRLGGIADLFLIHDRPIHRRADDSIVRVIADRPTVLRAARGYAPTALVRPDATEPIVALGGHQKNAVAVAGRGRIVLGAHLGDLTGTAAREAYAGSVAALAALHRTTPAATACDAHPDYHSTRFAETMDLPARRVPHHLAHVLAGMADNEIEGPVLGVAWDGTGHGRDGTVWGGEFIRVDGGRYRRAAHLGCFRLPGGEAAMREPRRAALGVLYGLYGEAAFDMNDLPPVAAFAPGERRVLANMLTRGVNAPLTSSAGRLFDAVAALLDLKLVASFEGEAAMAVEFAADRAGTPHPLAATDLTPGDDGLVVDWRPTLATLIAARRNGVPADDLAAGFHAALAEGIAAVARRIGVESVLLTGGCFQNALLTERTVARLRLVGCAPFWHHRVPPNDGGLAVGQAVFAARPLTEERV
jgi:hydrogenase maturation protein HypF